MNSNANYGTAANPQSPTGLTTALNELFEVAGQTFTVADGIEHSLGLSASDGEAGANTQAPKPEFPVARIYQVIRGLRMANDKLHAACGHLNT